MGPGFESLRVYRGNELSFLITRFFFLASHTHTSERQKELKAARLDGRYRKHPKYPIRNVHYYHRKATYQHTGQAANNIKPPHPTIPTPIKTKWGAISHSSFCGQRWIRTTEVERQQIYSLPHLATLEFAQTASLSKGTAKVQLFFEFTSSLAYFLKYLV